MVNSRVPWNIVALAMLTLVCSGSDANCGNNFGPSKTLAATGGAMRHSTAARVVARTAAFRMGLTGAQYNASIREQSMRPRSPSSQ